jgi:hypothetical protein
MPAEATPSQPGHHREVTRAPPSSAKLQCGAPPMASIPKTRDQPEEPNSKQPPPCGNNASTGISRVPPTRQQMRGPTSDRQDAPHLVQATTGNARTKKANGVRAGRPRPAANHRRALRPSYLPRVASQARARLGPAEQHRTSGHLYGVRVRTPSLNQRPMGRHPVHTLYRCGTKATARSSIGWAVTCGNAGKPSRLGGNSRPIIASRPCSE